MYVKSCLLAVLLLGTFIPVPFINAQQKASASAEQSRLQQQVEGVLQQIDSKKSAGHISTDEFIVNAFLLIKNRNPHTYEFYSFKELHTEYRMKRSDLIALLLAGDDNNISWDACRSLLDSKPIENLKNTAAIQQVVESLKNASREEILKSYQDNLKAKQSKTESFSLDFKIPNVLLNGGLTATSAASSVPYETYNTYFGFLHSHTSYSDGAGTPEQAYQYARHNGKLDFFAVTDHGELLSTWPWNNEWNKIKAAANANYVPGSYVTLWGFEWSNPVNGHVNVLNTNDFTNTILRIGVGDLYNWLHDRPTGFGTFNHPGKQEYLGIEFQHLDVSDALVIPLMVGIETWNGSDSFDLYHYQNKWFFNDGSSYLDTGNRKGWFLGALGAQDNHTTDWGTKNQYRTGVLAKNLTREEIINAYRARRFYATEDKDLVLDFRCSGYPMGSQLTGVPRNFTITATDRSGDTFTEVRLFRNGTLIAVNNVSGNSINTTFTDSAVGSAYYYVMVKQNDDNDNNGRKDEALSSSIWIQ